MAQVSLFEHELDPGEVLKLIAGAKLCLLKFLSANDLGLTGSHQAGIYLSAQSWRFFLDGPGHETQNQEQTVRVDWGDGASEGCFKWYASVREYRLTRVRDYFRNHEDEFLGALFLLLGGEDQREVSARVITDEQTIEQVLNFFGITPADTGGLLDFDLDERLRPECEAYLKETGAVFPDSDHLSRRAQRIFEQLYETGRSSIARPPADPDDAIVRLVEIEYALFRFLEHEIYRGHLATPFGDVTELLGVALEIINRRKSRAGRSLENHLAYIFDRFGLSYGTNEITEGRKRPDFLFPGINEYHDPTFPTDRLLCLGAKTTCKDRWRQVLSEADRLGTIHLFTLQQGISSAQLEEMHGAGVVPVIPADFHKLCRPEDRSRLLDLRSFLELALERNGRRSELPFGSP
ncbi:MAG: hypothetical protein H7A21_17230 [Spirochaetales bacterium]|nr:hypothetical protein [Leptospiraceae bacterium]MCP5483184.1 hypothetical protein [Spirochaetales bacterium]MCP5486688.1 hypothetical protein [Spirochaetales bacterium]